MKFDLIVKDRAGNGVDNLKYRILVIVDKNRKIKREIVSSVTKSGKGKGETIVGLEELIFEVIGFPSAYSNWTEVGTFSYGKRMNKEEKRAITIIVPSIIINTKTFPKQEITGNYQRKLKTLKSPLDEKIYLYPIIIKHIITQGETLESIAGKHKTTIEDIKLRNKIKGDLIRIGGELIIKDKFDVNKELWTAQKNYKKYIKENFEVSKDNSKVVTSIEQESRGTQLMYINLSGAIAASIGVGASIQLGVARTPSGKWGVFLTPSVSGVQGTPSISVEGGYLISEAKTLDDLKGFVYSVNANFYVLVVGSAVVATGLNQDQLAQGELDEGTTPGGGVETGLGLGANVQHNLDYTFVISLEKFGF